MFNVDKELFIDLILVFKSWLVRFICHPCGSHTYFQANPLATKIAPNNETTAVTSSNGANSADNSQSTQAATSQSQAIPGLWLGVFSSLADYFS